MHDHASPSITRMVGPGPLRAWLAVPEFRVAVQELNVMVSRCRQRVGLSEAAHYVWQQNLPVGSGCVIPLQIVSVRLRKHYAIVKAFGTFVLWPAAGRFTERK